MRFLLPSGVLAALAIPTTGVLVPPSAGQAELHPIVAPTERPDYSTTDPWDCVTESIKERYFDPLGNPPRPSGALADAKHLYGSVLLETCRTTGIWSYRYPCDFPDKTLWCGITTALPASLLPAYWSYASSAWSWWSVHSSDAVRVAQMCPILWYELGNHVVGGGAVWMNHTLIEAECYAEAHLTVTGSPGTGPTAIPGQGAIAESAPTSTSSGASPTDMQTTTSIPSSGCAKLPIAPGLMMLPLLAVFLAVAASAPCQSTFSPQRSSRHCAPSPANNKDSIKTESATVHHRANTRAGNGLYLDG
ncbi:hypothetical protein N658DRAFT_418837 [Parathielavia hyrcaniae]|uniref:DUF7735 domain-containing protein n=1 Tax=Parathielavia hyrcaniae TaxID=113614 RepID=A0AAN6Q7J9_9PEZI|nr:hypothetical protein N658DRAFT_418837 [Parathielavia hyrcaniae]